MALFVCFSFVVFLVVVVVFRMSLSLSVISLISLLLSLSSRDDADGFYYDQVVGHDGMPKKLRIRSIVGLFPLIASGVTTKSSYR
jgi:hypothetical protein